MRLSITHGLHPCADLALGQMLGALNCVYFARHSSLCQHVVRSIVRYLHLNNVFIINNIQQPFSKSYLYGVFCLWLVLIRVSIVDSNM